MKYTISILIFCLLATCHLPLCSAFTIRQVGELSELTPLTATQTMSSKKKKQPKQKKNRKKQPSTLISGALSIPTLSEEQQRKYDYYFLEAIRLKLKKEYDAGFEMLQHCLSIHPYAASAHYEIAQYYLSLKQPTQVITALEKAVLYEPQNFWYNHGLYNLYLQQNETDKAIDLLETMTERFPDKLDPLYNLLDAYSRLNEYDQVIHTLNRLESKMGKNEQLSMEKFRCYLQKGDDKKAFKEIESLASEYPNDPRYRVILGDVYLQNGKKEEAYQQFQQVLKEEPDNAMARYSLAAYYEETGQEELHQQQLDSLLLNKKVDANTKMNVMRKLIIQNEQEGGDSIRIIRLFDRIMEQEPEDASLPMLYAQYLISKNMEPQSWPVLELVLDIDPTNTAARMTLLGEAIRKEDYKKLTQLCEAGVESNPDRLEFYFYLAIGYNQAERTDDALAICQKALKHVTPQSNKELVSDFYTIIGDSWYNKNQHEKAYEAYDSALIYKPDNIGTLNNYAYYLSLENKQLDKAEEMSYKTVKAEPNNATYLDTYAWILFMKGNYTEARIYIDNAMKSDGEKSADVIEHCGDIYYMNGDVEGAVRYWEKALEIGAESNNLKRKITQRKYIPSAPK